MIILKHMFIVSLCGVAGLLCACDSKKESSQAQIPSHSKQASALSEPVENKARPGSFLLANLEHEVAAGLPSSISFEVKPGKGLKINPQYPWKLTLDEPEGEGVTLEQGLVLKKDVMTLDASHAVIPITLTASSDGEYELQGSLNLSVCEKGDEARCLWFTDEPVTLKVKAKSEPE